MARAAWKGYISLGQLGIPVRLYSATRSIRPHFVQLHESDGSPIERQLRCRAEQREISATEIIRAIELTPGNYLALTEQELDGALTTTAKTIALQQFAPPNAIPPYFYDKVFSIVPARGGERGYVLLREVLERAQRIAVARFAIYGSEHLAAVGVVGDMLVLYQLRYAAEIVPRSEVKLPPLPRPTPKEIDTLSAVVERLSGPLYLEDYHDDYADHLDALIERKTKGLPPRSPERIAPHTTPEDELIPMLERVLQSGKHLPAQQYTIE